MSIYLYFNKTNLKIYNVQHTNITFEIFKMSFNFKHTNTLGKYNKERQQTRNTLKHSITLKVDQALVFMLKSVL